MNRKRPNRLLAAAAAVTVGLLVGAAILLTLVRVLFTQVDALRHEVERELSAQFGASVTIARLSGRLDGLRPMFTLTGVTVDSASVQGRIETARLAFAPGASLAAGAPRLASVGLEGVRLTLIGSAATLLPPPERLRVAAQLEALHDLPLPPRFRLDDARLRWRADENRPAPAVGDLRLAFDRDGDGLHLRGDFRPPAELGAAVAFRFHASDPSLGQPTAAGYLDVGELDFAAITDRLTEFGLPPPAALGGQAEGEFWLDFGPGNSVAGVSRLRAREIAVNGVPRIAALDAVGAARLDRRGWSLDADFQRFQPVGRPPWRDLRASVRREPGRWRVGLEAAVLRDLPAIAGPALPERWRERIAWVQPRGRVERLGVAWSDTAPRQWRARGSVEGFRLLADPTPGRRLPGIDGVEFDFDATATGGRFDIRGRDGALTLPRWFDASLPFDTLTANGHWRVDPDDGRVQVAVPRLAVANADARVSARGTVWAGGERGLFLDIRAALEDGRGASATHYLPAKILPPPLVDWLDEAIVGGDVERADVVLFGPAAAFPFRGGEGVFDARAEVANAHLAYLPQWPALRDGAGELRFHNAGMTVDADDGQINGVALEHAAARIDDFRQAELRIDAGFRGAGSDMLGFLLDTPLLADGPGPLAGLEFGGTHDLALALDISFDGAPPVVAGRLGLSDGVLALPDLGYRISELTGDVRFDRDGIAWDGLQGRFAGAPLLSRGRTVGEGEDARIRSDTRFRAGAADLLPQRDLGERLSGQAEWLLTLDAAGFRNDVRDYRVLLDSDLLGLRVDAPAPIGKPADLARRFRLRGRFDPDRRRPWRIDYGDGLAMVALLDEARERPRRLGLRFGGGEPTLPQGRGIRVEGRLARLPGQIGGLMPGEGGDGAGLLPPLTELDLTLERLDAGSYRLGPLTLDGGRTDDGFRLQLTGAANGTATWRSNASGPQADIDLERLAVGLAEPAEAEPDDAPPQFDLTQLPDITAEIDELSLGERVLGRLAFDLRRTAERLELRSLALETADLTLTATADWDTEAGRSRLSAEADIANAGAALTGLGFTPALRDGHGEASADLHWDGPLISPNYETFGGTLGFDLRDGSLPAVEPGAGRLVGLLSLTQVPRRLALDFSDVTDRGLVFDRLQARFEIENGIARPEVFSLDGPAVEIDITGPVDLARREYDQTVTVVPQLSSTLPLLGGFAAGPQVGVMLFLAEKLLSSGVDNLTRFSYRIEGSWDNPQWEPLAPVGESTEEGP